MDAAKSSVRALAARWRRVGHTWHIASSCTSAPSSASRSSSVSLLRLKRRIQTNSNELAALGRAAPVLGHGATSKRRAR
eukprot:7390627-Pyramimonas_sp.AAC.1